MRVLLINQVFYPDVAATAQHADDLAQHLVRHGHEVHVIAGRALYGQKGASLPARETHEGVRIHRVGRSLFGKSSTIGRAVDFALFYLAATVKAFRLPRADVAVCLTTPPFIALLGWLVRATRGSRFVYWVMDLYPDAPVVTGMFKPRSPVTRVLERINRFCLRRADASVVLGRCMEELVRAKVGDANGASASRARIERIGVWSDAAEVAPLPRQDNPFRRDWSLGDAFVVMYSGNFGLLHDVDTMLQAALRLRDDERVRFVFSGGGKKKDSVERFVREHELENVTLSPYQPREKLDALLSCADAHLATLTPGAEGVVVPCKLFGIMAAGRPTLFVGSAKSELARVLDEHDAGVVIEPGDVDGLVAAITGLADDRARAERMGSAARRALADAYSRESACERWRAVLESVAEPKGAAHDAVNAATARPAGDAS
jgi:glycosyltransferase involved in cell wall biosynthesis